MSAFLDRPDDQCIYMIAATSALLSCLLLKQLTNPTHRRLFSLIAGLSINFFVFGCSAAAMLAINVACYLVTLICPSRSQHVGVFVVAGLGLTGA